MIAGRSLDTLAQSKLSQATLVVLSTIIQVVGIGP
jgi:hypothetical protein